MSNLLNAANVSTNKNFDAETQFGSTLPTKLCEVSVMTVQEVFNALHGFRTISTFQYDPTPGYGISAYHVYGIAGANGENSTLDNLKNIGVSWYKQLNKPTKPEQTFSVNGQTVFGGPLIRMVDYAIGPDEKGEVAGRPDDEYAFEWVWMEDEYDQSVLEDFWDRGVPSSTYVAVVRAHE